MRLLGRSSLVFCLVLAVWYTFPGDFAFASKDKKENYIVLTFQPGKITKVSPLLRTQLKRGRPHEKWAPIGPTRALKIKYSDCFDDERRYKTLVCMDWDCTNLKVDSRDRSNIYQIVNGPEPESSDEALIHFAAVRKREGLLSVAKALKVIPLPTKDRDLFTGACVLRVYDQDYRITFRLKGHSYVDIHRTDDDYEVNAARLYLNAKMIREVPAEDEAAGEDIHFTLDKSQWT